MKKLVSNFIWRLSEIARDKGKISLSDELIDLSMRIYN